ncbi:hypothetical protein [Alkalihalobacillus pseudalcaliphilus]|uniref:hypothetical protein n=1 Tax=Alkalihalobacillus pseudalcaliphilus TaxID=79884 RepID=UPI00064DFDE9|nr:hypothetical protein [Alkalihalobacillus pseudalcaliphilus]KMK76585.1 hypothetical protein AB990_15580 [Alkalihalobacillus pseudalcaliphilus]
MTFIISYGIHVLISVIFFILIPLPILIKGIPITDTNKLKVVFAIYRPIFKVAHGAIVLSFISGVVMVTDWLTSWTVAVILLWLIIGALLGITAKKMREMLEYFKENRELYDEMASLFQSTLWLSLAVIAMFAIKILPYFYG